MYNNWPFVARLNDLFFPREVRIIIFVCLEQLLRKFPFLLQLFHLFIFGYNFWIGLGFRGICSLILQVEADWLLEIDLDRTTLVLAAQGVEDLHVDFGTIEGTISFIDLKLLTRCPQCIS